MSIDEIAEYRKRIEARYTTRRKSLRDGGRRVADDRRVPPFFDAPLILMALVLIALGLFLTLSE